MRIFKSLFLLILSFIKYSNCFYFNNHTIISISGWPQSGTSLINEMLDRIKGVSTMIDRCTLVNSQYNCVGFNFEGQWMISGQLVKTLHSGKMCSIDENDFTLTYEKKLTYWWGKLWDQNEPYLVEKSPQNMLKIPFLQQLYKNAKSTKYLIVIKHPLTLNIALPKRSKWSLIYQYCNKKTAQQRQSFMKNSRYVDQFDIHHSFSTLKLLLEGETNQFNLSNSSCKLLPLNSKLGYGWINSMKILSNWLHTNKQFTLEHVKILRYEDLVQHSHQICLELLSFFFDISFQEKEILQKYIKSQDYQRNIKYENHNNQTNTAFFIINNCQILFPDFHHRLIKNKRLLTTTQNVQDRRQLRLHLSEDGKQLINWSFDSSTAKKSCYERLLSYQKVFNGCMDNYMKEIISKFDDDLRLFGYSSVLKGKKDDFYQYSRSKTEFDEWDIGFQIENRYFPSHI